MAEYGTFRVAGEGDLFRLAVAEYSGNATDALAAHSGKPFSTWDANHDTAPACCPCAPAYSAGWWFYRWVQVPVAPVEAPEAPVLAARRRTVSRLVSLLQLLRGQPQRRVPHAPGGERVLPRHHLGGLAGRLFAEGGLHDGESVGHRRGRGCSLNQRVHLAAMFMLSAKKCFELLNYTRLGIRATCYSSWVLNGRAPSTACRKCHAQLTVKLEPQAHAQAAYIERTTIPNSQTQVGQLKSPPATCSKYI